MSVDVRAVRTQFLAIEKHVIQIRETGKPTKQETNGLLSEYDNARNAFNRIMSREKIDVDLRYFGFISQDKYYEVAELMTKLREIEIQCQKGVEALAGLVILMPKEELDRLRSLRKELESLSAELDDINYEKNVAKAIDEYEAGHTLASALISSRVIIYALDKIPGKEAEDKVKFLDEKKIIDKKGKDPGEFILKANKKARNFFSHDIKAFPDPSDAISLLGDMIAILRIIVKLEEASKS